MILYLLRRILYAVPIALAVSLVCFMLVHIAPGDPVNAIVPADAPRPSSSKSATSTASTSRCQSSSASG